MLVTVDQATEYIGTGKLFHISGATSLLRRLPKGNWLGGSTEFFMDKGGGKATDQLLSLIEIPGESYRIETYGVDGISRVGKNAFANGYTILILPFDSEIHSLYAEKAAYFDDIFLNPVIGWIAADRLDKADRQSVSANGAEGEVYADKAVALHMSLPAGQSAELNMINIFEPDLDGPSILFPRDGFVVDVCLIDGKETVFADYIAETGLDTKLPLVGDYSGANINISIKEIADGKVYFYAPLSGNVQYRFAKRIDDYAEAFRAKIGDLSDTESVFTCNCILNFMYGALENEDLGTFYGPFTFGEVAWQLVNQTLVYLQIK
ncbi:MAG: hypothetical protein LBO81_07055 [Clostridiales Family XIII bacterium]|jgi:hypothetical protein|nr:hypothetical protein [Clostridiales Family XIII bacterium]